MDISVRGGRGRLSVSQQEPDTVTVSKVHKQTTHVVATILLLMNVSLVMDMFYSGMETDKNLVLLEKCTPSFCCPSFPGLRVGLPVKMFLICTYVSKMVKESAQIKESLGSGFLHAVSPTNSLSIFQLEPKLDYES